MTRSRFSIFVSLELRSVLPNEVLRLEQCADRWGRAVSLGAFESGGTQHMVERQEACCRVDGFKYPKEPRVAEGVVAGTRDERGRIGWLHGSLVRFGARMEGRRDGKMEGRVPSGVLTTSFDSSVVVWMLALPARAVVGSRAE